jgi:hypothetical protein
MPLQGIGGAGKSTATAAADAKDADGLTIVLNKAQPN